MIHKPSISIIIQCYNNVTSIKHTIESILSQSFPNFEVIMIDDNSTDGTFNEIIKLVDKRFHCIRNKRYQGKYASYNKGLKLAKGKYVCWSNAEDIFFPSRLKIQMDYMERYPKVGCVGSNAELINKKGIILEVCRYPLSNPDIKAALLKSNCVCFSSLMFKSSFIRKHQIKFNERLQNSSDYAFIVECSKLFQLRNINETLVKHRVENQLDIIGHQDNNTIKLEQLKRFEIEVNQDDTELHLKLMNGDYVSDLELDDGTKWLNYLLEENENRKLYKSKSLYNIFLTTLQDAVRKNSLGGWSIEKEVLSFIKRKLPLRKTILEFGSGEGTNALLTDYNVISIEHDINYAYKRSSNHICIYSPLNDNWYHESDVKKALTLEYDLILIDGPPRELREGILKNLHLFKHTASPVIFDDVNRSKDREIMLIFCNVLNYNFEIHQCPSKSFAYCLKGG